MATYHDLTIAEFQTMVPSTTVRNYAREAPWNFSDLSRACLIANSDARINDKIRYLRRIQEYTEDKELYAQIESYISGVQSLLQSFKQNGKPYYTYILYLMEDDIDYSDPDGYFTDFDLAFDAGVSTKKAFRIEKRALNMLLEKSEFYAEIRYDNEGDLINIYYSTDDRMVTYQGHPNFMMSYIFVPNPFERGDIVYHIRTNQYGVVETSKDDDIEWFIHDANQVAASDFDFTDVAITVAFLNCDGTFSHQHINPVYLEKYSIEVPWSEASARDRLLSCAQDIYRGEGSLEEITYLQNAYRNFQAEVK